MSDTSQDKIEIVCNQLKSFLLEKNNRYGDSALNPKRIASKLDNKEQIKIRIDDKLSRIEKSTNDRKNDYVDLAGYIILLCIANDWLNFEDLID